MHLILMSCIFFFYHFKIFKVAQEVVLPSGALSLFFFFPRDNN